MKRLFAALSATAILATGCSTVNTGGTPPSKMATSQTSNWVGHPGKLTPAKVRTDGSGCKEKQYENDCWLPAGAHPNEEAITGDKALSVKFDPSSRCWGNTNRRLQQDCWPSNGEAVQIICAYGDWAAIRYPIGKVRNGAPDSDLKPYDSMDVYGWVEVKWLTGFRNARTCDASES